MLYQLSYQAIQVGLSVMIFLTFISVVKELDMYASSTPPICANYSLQCQALLCSFESRSHKLKFSRKPLSINILQKILFLQRVIAVLTLLNCSRCTRKQFEFKKMYWNAERFVYASLTTDMELRSIDDNEIDSAHLVKTSGINNSPPQDDQTTSRYHFN